jgi:hypothetical protein
MVGFQTFDPIIEALILTTSTQAYPKQGTTWICRLPMKEPEESPQYVRVRGISPVSASPDYHVRLFNITHKANFAFIRSVSIKDVSEIAFKALKMLFSFSHCGIS